MKYFVICVSWLELLQDISSTASKMLEDLFLKEECSILHVKQDFVFVLLF